MKKFICIGILAIFLIPAHAQAQLKIWNDGLKTDEGNPAAETTQKNKNLLNFWNKKPTSSKETKSFVTNKTLQKDVIVNQLSAENRQKLTSLPKGNITDRLEQSAIAYAGIEKAWGLIDSWNKQQHQKLKAITRSKSLNLDPKIAMELERVQSENINSISQSLIDNYAKKVASSIETGSIPAFTPKLPDLTAGLLRNIPKSAITSKL